MLKVDIHTHILPKTWPDLKKKYGYGGFIRLEHHCPGKANMWKDDEFFREIDSNCWDPEKRIDECRDAGVDVQVLSTVPVMFSYWAKPEDTLDLSRYLNDHIAELCKKYPQNFVGLGTLPMQAPDLAVKELERCIKSLGLSGIEIGTHVNGKNLDDPEIFPVLEAAEELGAAVFVHPWDMLAWDRMEKYWMPWLVSMPCETTVAICSMIFGGVFDRLPNLKVAFAHGGGSFPGTIGRIQYGYEVRPDLCAVNDPDDPRSYVERFFVDSLVHDGRALQYLLDLMGEERIVLGTDYPFPLGESVPGKLIESRDWSDDTKARLLGLNAMDWLGLKAEIFQGA